MVISVSFPFSWAAQPVANGPASLDAGFLYRVLSPTGLVSKLPDFLFSPSYIIVQRPPSCGRHNHTHSTHPRSRLYSDIPWADAPVIYIGAFPILTAWPGRRSIYNTISTMQYKDWIEYSELLLLLSLSYLFEIFHTNVSRMFSSGVRVTVSLLKPSGLFLVFGPILIMLSLG